MEYFIPPEHSLKILWKSKHFPGRYRRKREWVFFSEHSVESLTYITAAIGWVYLYICVQWLFCITFCFCAGLAGSNRATCEKQESLADANVSARQQCVYECP